MYHGGLLVGISLLYIGILFFIAWWGDQQARRYGPSARRPIIYSLAMAVYCTSWSFYGSVGQAAAGGWIYLSIFIGPILMFTLGWPVLNKILCISKAQNITSIADFIASRYGKTQTLAVIVTLIALVGTLPYIALQLKAVAMAYNVLTSYPETHALTSGEFFLADTAFYVAAVMALFAILFGTRHIDATEHHEGLILAIAFESVIKLIAFLAVGVFITFGLFNGFQDLLSTANYYLELERQLNPDVLSQGFLAQTLLSMVAILALPRQFHVMVVENTHPDDCRTARWLFPLYLGLIALFVLPVAAAGLITFSDGFMEPDTYMLTLPMQSGATGLTLLAFIGGFSAATSMVIMAAVAVSIMVSNEIVIPLLLKIRWSGKTLHRDYGRLVLIIRRLTIVGILILAYFSYLTLAEFNSLASTGFLSFAAIAQLGPSLLVGIYWKQGSRQGALAGLAVGFILWTYLLLLPSLNNAGFFVFDLMESGPWGLTWLSPVHLFGANSVDFFTQGVLVSLLANLMTYVLVSRLTKQRVIDRIQASAFTESIETRPAKINRPWLGNTSIGDLYALCERFLGAEATEKAFNDYTYQRNLKPLRYEERASIQVIQFCERLLAGVLGASSARIVISSALQGKDIQISDVISIVDEASQVLEFNRALLQATIENLNQGISVVDQNMRLVIWNQRYLELFHYPDNFIHVGKPIAEIFRFNADAGEYGSGDPAEQTQELLDNIQAGEPHKYIRYRHDASVLEIQGNPMPGGGFVYTYQDITQQKQTEEALIQSENNIRIYTDNVPALIAYFDTEQRYLFTNKAYEEAMHVDRNTIIGQPIYSVLDRNQYQLRVKYIQSALTGSRQVFELELPTLNQCLRYALVTYTPHISEQGQVLGFFALYQDITERRLAEIALQETNEHLEERVQERTQKLSELNTALQQENIERARTQEALGAAKQQAEEANASKTRFLAAASHDLLQPLNAARLFTSALAQQAHDAQVQKTITNIDNSLKAAEELLSTLLDISKLDAGALHANVSEFHLQDILQPLKAEFEVLAARRKLNFRVVSTQTWVRSDSQMLRRIVQNFLSNAIRYTQTGKILLGCRRQAGSIWIQVWDTGPGIPEAKLKEIFQEFRRLDTPDRHNEKGLGLGLSIADRMARVLEHTIKVRSWPGEGTLFSVQVPCVPAPQVEETTTSDSQTALRASLNTSLNPLAEIKVLCIDNEPLILEGMQAMLSGWQCQVFTATTIGGAKSILRHQAQAPVIFLADYHLDNDVTGVMALQALQEVLGPEALTGIVITADRTDEVADEVQAAGYALLHKPVKPAALRALMTRLLQKRRMARH